MKRINIFPNVSVYVSNEMILLLELIQANGEVSVNSVDTPNKKLLKEMFERNLLVRRRKNNEVSYNIRPGLNWK